MHRQSKLPVKLWLVLLGAILITAGMTSVSLAKTETLFHGTHNFIILQATNTTAYFTIDNDCDDIDKNCTVFVRRNIHFDPSGDDGFEDEWKAEIDGGNTGIVGCSMDGTGESGRNRDFELCWEAVERGGNPGLEFTIEWPSINPDDDFEVTPYCKRGDDVCAAELRVCYNANDCDGNSYGRQSWTEVGELWDEAGSCLYDDDEDEVWECLDEALDDWLDDNMDHDDDYGDLEDEEEEDRGFTLEDYEDDLSSVGRDWATPRRAENASARSPRQETSRTPTTVYQPRTSVDTRQSGSRLTGNEYLTVNFTAYLEAKAPYQVCNTIIGCVTVATLSNTFWPNTQNLHIVIQDAGVLSCMGGSGWDVGNNHAISFDNTHLIACDARIRTANQVCPAKDTGASGDLFAMWDTGLLKGLLPDSYAHGLRLQVERARGRTPDCLCTSGFANNNLVVTSGNTAGPRDLSGALQTTAVCN